MIRPMGAGLSPLDVSIWVGGSLLESAVFGLAIFRGLPRRFPVFTLYLGLVLVKEGLHFCFYYFAGINSHPYFYFSWLSQAVLLVARGLVVAELFNRVLRPYRGVWA